MFYLKLNLNRNNADRTLLIWSKYFVFSPIIKGCGASRYSIKSQGNNGTNGKCHLNGQISLKKHFKIKISQLAHIS